jgi:hypothetical protein
VSRAENRALCAEGIASVEVFANGRAKKLLNQGKILRVEVKGLGVKFRSIKLVPKKSRGGKTSHRSHKRAEWLISVS